MSLIELLIAPGAVIGGALFMWRILVRMEDRIVANADKAHNTAIGDNIKRLDGRIDMLHGEVSGLREEVSGLREDVGFIKGTLQTSPDLHK